MTFKEACIAQEFNLPVIVLKSGSTEWSDEKTVYNIREVHRSYDTITKHFFHSVTVYNKGRACYQIDIALIRFVDSQSVEDFVLDKLRLQEKAKIKNFISKLLDKYNSKKSVFEYLGPIIDEVKAERKAAGIKGTGNQERKEIYEEIISYLNTEAGLKLKPTSSNVKQLIDARMNEGYTVDDFKKVIKIKSADWKGTDMSKYLRPSTLFSKAHFEEYLNQKEKSTQLIDNGTDYDEQTRKALLNNKYDI